MCINLISRLILLFYLLKRFKKIDFLDKEMKLGLMVFGVDGLMKVKVVLKTDLLVKRSIFSTSRDIFKHQTLYIDHKLHYINQINS